jgi:Ca-activated chloride channel family protein
MLARLLAALSLVPIVAGISSEASQQVSQTPPAAWVIVLDISSSMTAEDLQPENRLRVAKTQLEKFIAANSNLELGLITFAATSRLVVPVTSDHQALAEALENVQSAGYGEDGTAIGSGIASAINRLRGQAWSERRILLITDGVSNRGVVSPMDAARLARMQGIRVHAIGLGTDSMARYWVPSLEGSPVQMRARLEIDDAGLEALATETGGSYHRAKKSQEFENALSSLKTGDSTPRAVTSQERKYHWVRALAWMALFSLVLEFAWTYWLFAELTG